MNENCLATECVSTSHRREKSLLMPRNLKDFGIVDGFAINQWFFQIARHVASRRRMTECEVPERKLLLLPLRPDGKSVRPGFSCEIGREVKTRYAGRRGGAGGYCVIMPREVGWTFLSDPDLTGKNAHPASGANLDDALLHQRFGFGSETQERGGGDMCLLLPINGLLKPFSGFVMMAKPPM